VFSHVTVESSGVCFYNALLFFRTKTKLFNHLRPDYPSKFFPDKRNSYVLLLLALAADAFV